MDYFNGYGRNSYGGTSFGQSGNQMYSPQSYQPANSSFGLKSGIQYATKTEMEALILPPSTQVWAMGKEGDVFYVKTADELGRSTVNTYEYKKSQGQPTNEDKGYLTKQEAENFATKDELKKVLEQYTSIEKLLRGANDGKEKKNNWCG